MPHLTRFHGRSVGSSLDGPVPTIETHLTDGIVLPWMAQHNTGLVGHSMHEPVSTILGKGCTQMLAAAWLSQMHGTNTGNGGDPRQPLGAILAQGNHHAAVQALLERTAKPGQHHEAVVAIDGQEWAVADIGMRMLTPRELYNAQGFPPDYLIDVLFEGKRLSKASQVRMCGNSVCPGVAAALVRANAPDLARSAIAA
ncbi:Putative C-5 cytosine-specific DNA methylase (fragment) (plasmid) [Magnetospirillum sp. XM-1]|uniref:DNA cytosine methyltransferase n=1 Tax=Magnetospirillum sp. XM-1 TaxID=1663591 RepID=UPI00073DCD88